MSRDLMFDIFAVDNASAVFSKVGAEAAAVGDKAVVGSHLMSGALLTAGAAAIGFGVHAVKMAGDFEASMTRLTTTAGESPAALKAVGDGILQMAGKVGFTASELANAMYDVESGGYHGAQGLTVLEAAAKGARVEGANVTDVAHALTGALNDYRGSNLTAVEATNAMTAAVGSGMMRFQDLAEAMPKIGARAAAAHVSLEEMLAAMGTMTADGLPASVSATYLGQAIGQLAAPTAKARGEMAALGIDSTHLAQTITSGSGHGLGDAINMLYDAITSKMNPAGLVALDTFKKSAGATADWQKMVANVPPTLQTQVQALAAATGGVKSFQAILMLGGQHAQQYADNLAAVNAQVTKGGQDVAGFSQAQETLNGKLNQAKGAVSAFTIEIGQKLTPAAKDSLGAFTSFMNFLTAHQQVVLDLGFAVGIAAASFTALKAAQVAWIGIQAAVNVAQTVGAFISLAAEVRGASSALALFQTAFAGVGFGAAGPIALAIGATAGVAFALYQTFNHGNDDLKRHEQAVKDLAGTYDDLTNSITAATRTKISDSFDTFKDKGGSGMNASQAGAILGLNQRDLIDAATGDAAAIQKVSDALDNVHRIQDEVDRGLRTAGPDFATNANAAHVLGDALGSLSSDASRASQKHREMIFATRDLAAEFKDMPGATQIIRAGLQNTAEDVARLANQFNLSDEDIQRILNTEMVPTTLDAVHQMQGALQSVGNVQPNFGPFAASLDAQLNSIEGQMFGRGASIAGHLVDGITGKLESPTALAALNFAGGGMLGAVLSGANNTGQIHSPSRKTMAMGDYLVQGLAIGLHNGHATLRAAGSGAMSSTLGGLSGVDATVAGLSSKGSKKADLVDAIVTALQQSGLLNQRPPAVRTV